MSLRNKRDDGYGRERWHARGFVRKDVVAIVILLVISVAAYLVVVIPYASTQSAGMHARREAERAGMMRAQGEAGLRRLVEEYDSRHAAPSSVVADPYGGAGRVGADYLSLVGHWNGEPLGTIAIPKIGLYHAIVSGERVFDDVEGIMQVPGTALPSTMHGINTVLAGHNGVDGDSPFDDIDELGKGDRISMTMLGRRFEYRVESTQTVEPTQMSVLQPGGGDAVLTLITCTPRYVNSHRLVVRARLASVKDVDVADSMPGEHLPPAWMPYMWWAQPAALYVAIIAAVCRLSAVGRRGVREHGVAGTSEAAQESETT